MRGNLLSDRLYLALALVTLPLVIDCGASVTQEAPDQTPAVGKDRPAPSSGRMPDSRSTNGATDKLIGTWVIDPEAIKERDSYKSAAEAQRQMMESMISKLKQEFTFTRNKMKMEMEIAGTVKSQENDYTVKSVEGNRLVLAGKDQSGKNVDFTFEFDGDRLILHDNLTKESETLVLRRK